MRLRGSHAFQWPQQPLLPLTVLMACWVWIRPWCDVNISFLRVMCIPGKGRQAQSCLSFCISVFLSFWLCTPSLCHYILNIVIKLQWVFKLIKVSFINNKKKEGSKDNRNCLIRNLQMKMDIFSSLLEKAFMMPGYFTLAYIHCCQNGFLLHKEEISQWGPL